MRQGRSITRIGWVSLFLLFTLSCSLVTGGSPAPPVTDVPPATHTPTPTDATAPAPTPTKVPAADLGPIAKPVFAVFREAAPEVDPALPAMSVEPGLTNVAVPFVLSQEQVDRLVRNGFVVTPGEEKEFFTLYEKARYGNVPVFVTSDSLLHVYHLLFDKVLRTAERTYFIPMLHDLNRAMLDQTDATYQALRETPWEDAAKRTVAFVGVAGRLLDADFEVPAYAQELVAGELANVEGANGMLPSPIFPGLIYGEDYTQYIPRGHYTLSDDLKAYFKSMMWYGRMTFRLKGQDPEIGRAETRSALLLTHALYNAEVNGRPALELWRDLYSPTVFFVGRSDDLTALQYKQVMDAVYGEDVDAAELVDEAKLDAFIDLANQLPAPKILGLVIMDTDDEEGATKGLRFMGQRFVPDAYIFRQLIYRNVGTRDHRRGLPKGLDLFAAMGSARAYQLLDEMGETSYEAYPAQMAKMQDWLAGLTVEDWTETLYNTWLYTFYPLLDVPDEGYPTFMQSPAWLDKQLNTALGSWAELKHDTILYAKQVYAELGGGPPPPPPLPPRGYVEPVPHVYARLAALTAMTREGLADRGMLTEQDGESLQRLETLVKELQGMAEKELRGEPLTEEENTTIRFYGGTLEELTMAASDAEESEPGGNLYMDEEPQAAVIADVATDPDNEAGHVVLEEAVGRINELHAVVPIVEADGTLTLQVVKGGVFAYYEFVWPADDRLTDEAWRTMLDEGTSPDPPAWTGSFFTQAGANDELQLAILSFQKSVTGAYWDQRTEFRDDEPALAQFGPEIEQLRADRRYMGHQLVSTDFRSFDQQAPDVAVVTVREVWQDTLHAYGNEGPTYGEPVLARRGPYTQDVTYTVKRVTYDYGTLWRVTNAVYADAPPAW